MANAVAAPRGFDLGEHGIRNLRKSHFNLGTALLIEQALQRKEGILAESGALGVNTGQFTGRSPKDKFIVRDAITDSTVNWGPVNQSLTPEQFARLHSKLLAFL